MGIFVDMKVEFVFLGDMKVEFAFLGDMRVEWVFVPNWPALRCPGDAISKIYLPHTLLIVCFDSLFCLEKNQWYSFVFKMSSHNDGQQQFFHSAINVNN